MILSRGNRQQCAASLALLGVFPGSTAFCQSEDRAGFERGYQNVEELMERRKWSAARDALVELVRAHEEAVYVLQERADLLEDLIRCSFWTEHEEPELEDLISGELVSYRRSSGKVKLRYARDQLADFLKINDTSIVHPLTFEGAYSVEISFAPYPSSSYPYVVVGFDTEHPVRAVFGRKKEGRGSTLRWLPATIEMFEKEEWKVAAREDNPPIKHGKPCKVKATVKSGSVTIYANGRKIIGARRKQGIYGQIALIDVVRGQLKEIVIQGDAQPSWFQGLIDEAIQEKWSAYEETFDPGDHLPAWLMGEASNEPAGTVRELPYPGPEVPGQEDLIEDVIEALEERDVDVARVKLLASKRRTSEAFRAFASALIRMYEGDWEAALESCQRAGELDGEHWGTRVLRARILRSSGRRQEAIHELEALRSDLPGDAEVVSELARSLLSIGSPDRAGDVLDRAIADGVHPAELEEIQTVLTKARHGPEWGRSFEYRSKNYHVASDIDEKICFEAANHLEKSLQRFNRDLRRLPRGERSRYRVYLFAGNEGYQTYLEGIVGVRVESTAGLYSSAVKQLLIWNLPDREQMFSTIRHEGFHQYFDALTDRPPRWLNEGLAEYYEMIELVGGKWKQGIPNRAHLKLLRNEKRHHVLDFMRISDRSFFQNVSLAYAQSWAMVHFLLHGGSKYKAVFDDLVDALVEGRDATVAVELALQHVDRARMQTDFAEHLAGL